MEIPDEYSIFQITHFTFMLQAEELPDISTESLPFYYKFGEIFQTIGKYCQDNGQAIILVIGCLFIFLIIIVAILFIQSLIYKPKNNMIQ
jgi:uncharacterized phage infection (PIP) family protein YhgE